MNGPALMEIQGGITAAGGFLAAGVHCGIKKQKRDLALVVSTVPAVAGAVFTTNKVIAAPLVVDKEQLAKSPTFRALVVNSGNANACTGERGLADAREMVRATAAAAGVAEHEVFVSSTGVIGQHLPMDRLTEGIATAARYLAPSGGSAAEAILTTDTFTKECAVECTIGGRTVHVGGMAKGSGMIAPNMATMLAFVTTDAAIAAPLLQQAVSTASDRSFNRITVDGDTSTNDMVLVLANGTAGNPLLQQDGEPDYAVFYGALEHVLVALSRMIVLDGEGATKLVRIDVCGARSEQEAVTAARSVANSNLVKTAIHGEDANWGRILAAVGYSGIDFDPDKVEIALSGLPILRPRFLIDFSEVEAKRVLQEKEILITVDLHQGDGSATFWTCDLSKRYVEINANYRT
jgi:glutamate N-acetyltransferase / amino-acid N-acetyltransferase